jgi:ligand-binding SRPBCC domain-containing protein
MRIRTLIQEQWLPVARDKVFAFFANAGNLDAITPSWLHFHVVTPERLTLQAGALFDYRLRVHGLPMRWQSEITVWEPPRRFVDVQRRGPYRRWVHEHCFADRDGGTLIRDKVEYAVPGWLLEPLVNRWLVAPDLRKIFAHRQARIVELMCSPSPSSV